MKKISLIILASLFVFSSCNKEKEISIGKNSNSNLAFNSQDAKDLYYSLFFGNGTYVSKIPSLKVYVQNTPTIMQKKISVEQDKIYNDILVAHPTLLQDFYSDIKSTNYELIKATLIKNQQWISDVIDLDNNNDISIVARKLSGIVTYPITIDCISKNVTFFDCITCNQFLDCVKYGSSTIYTATGRISGDCTIIRSFKNVANTTNTSIIVGNDCTFTTSSFIPDNSAYSRMSAVSRNPTTLEFYINILNNNLYLDAFMQELISVI